MIPTKILYLLPLTSLWFPSALAQSKSDLHTAAKASYLNQTEKDIVYEMNEVRTRPKKYAQNVVKPLLKFYQGKRLQMPGQTTLLTQEGVHPAKELYAFLMKATPVGTLSPSSPLSSAAQYHAEEQSKTGRTGHGSADGTDSFQRIERFGAFLGSVGENISYGSETAVQIVLQLLIDDGVASRGHRKNIMNASYKVCGLGFRKHKKWRYVAVIDYATQFSKQK